MTGLFAHTQPGMMRGDGTETRSFSLWHTLWSGSSNGRRGSKLMSGLDPKRIMTAGFYYVRYIRNNSAIAARGKSMDSATVPRMKLTLYVTLKP
jgi:hypothetical protein